jgi:hypothetical protein
MSSLVILGDTSGSITLQAPAAAGSGTVYTLPAATGTVMVSGNIPAFSAYRSTTQSISQTTWTIAVFNTEEFDTANFYNTSNGRFTPTIAGYYALSFNLELNVAFTGFMHSMFYKNGDYYTRGSAINASSQGGIVSGSVVMYLNGSTDYAQVGVFVSASGTGLSADSYSCRFSGCLVRAA